MMMVSDFIPFLIVLTLVAFVQPDDSTKSTQLDEQSKAECHYKGQVGISVQKTDNSLERLDVIPWKFICSHPSVAPHCINGTPPSYYQNLKLKDIGWYGSQSLHQNESGRLVVFETKKNHSDPDEKSALHGCTGEMHQANVPDEPWVALVARGKCKFAEKITNAAKAKAKAVLVYNAAGQKIVTMDHGSQDLVTMMTNNDTGINILYLQYFINNMTVPGYTNNIYVNITFLEKKCENPDAPSKPISVTIVAIVFVVMMIVALIWLVTYYIQRHRNLNKHNAVRDRLQKAAKKALRKLGERVLHEHDEETHKDRGHECTYCLEDFSVGDVIRELPCQHKFHKDCVDEWLIQNRTCPNCKDDLLVAMGVNVKGVNQIAAQGDDQEEGLELQEVSSERGQLLADDVSNTEEMYSSAPPYETLNQGGQSLPGGQLLTDGENMYLYVPGSVIDRPIPEEQLPHS